MTGSVHGEILGRLGLVVYERVADGVFLQIVPAEPPAWLRRVFPEADRNTPVALGKQFPFLDRFFTEAHGVWTPGASGRLRSEPFVVSDSSGGDAAIAATALAVGDRCFLVLESPDEFDAWRGTLQTAREQALAHEAQVRRTGALLPDVADIRQLAAQLAAGASPEQRQLADAIGARLERLAASLEALAPLPKGVSRRRRR